MSKPDLSRVPLADLAAELKRRAGEDRKSIAIHESVALDLASTIRKFGFYAQVWLPTDVDNVQDGLSDEETLEVLHLMEKNDEAAMVSNSELLEQLVSDVVSEREKGGAL